MLEVGIDSYITLEEAETYIKNYVTDEAIKAKWNALTGEQKEVYLRKAVLNIDKLHFGGIKVDSKQRLEFPRKYSGHYSGGYLVEEVPWAIKSAEVEEALFLTNGVPQSIKNQKKGIKSFSIGDLSETYAMDTISGNVVYANTMELIGKYLIGSVGIW